MTSVLTELGRDTGVWCLGCCILIVLATNCVATEDLSGKRGQGVVIFEDNALYQNNLAGIRVRGNMPVTIKTCKIYSNGRAGIAVDRKADIRVTDCDVYENGRAGVNIDEGGHTTIQNSKIFNNRMAGIRIWRSGDKDGDPLEAVKVKIANNRIYLNKQAGVRSMPQLESKVDLVVSGNDICQNGKAGLRVENNTGLTAKGNQIRDNGTVGIVSHESVVTPVLDIYQNTLSFNRGPGIHVINGVAGNIGIRNNWVYHNLRSGIVCGLWGDPDVHRLNVEIINNTVVANGSSDQGAGIRNDSKGRALILNNIVAYNYVSGIRSRKCKDDSYNLLFANGDVANCCDDPHSAPYWVERVQIGGCPERGVGGLITDPLFVDPDNYNFCLKGESPAIDAGKGVDAYNDASFPPSKGTSRNDMGATGGPYAAGQG
ncbi:MAG: right-handed parallel beta-helix repeat-containing protein [Thermodesulfobacteriota bacterium]|nr:right-handed parallel beta-helix repeat-containing protein [Thermodesulfobacteriota bacterium]